MTRPAGIAALSSHPDLRRRLALFASIGVVAAALIAGGSTARPADPTPLPSPPPAASGLTVVEPFTRPGLI